MSGAATLTSTVAGRYATALFELAKDSDALDTIHGDLSALSEAISASPDLKSLIRSPLYGRETQGRAIAAVADAMELSPTVRNLLGLMASKRRLFTLPDVIALFRELLAEHRGQVTADVTAARQLSDAQIDALKETLGRATGREVKLNIMIDPAIIGGLIVKVGSRMIDTSIRSRLVGLQNAMREVG